ncbi:MAG: alkaline phosphatase [Planctomycetota bacterium]|nr:alkaline phosphatase [Planctomycetota bacterium]
MHRSNRIVRAALSLLCVFAAVAPAAVQADPLREMQLQAVQQARASWGHWGSKPDRYSNWTTHSNRLIPVYSFGMSLDSVAGPKSAYRDADRLKEIFNYLPEATLNAKADYFDQTDIYRLQKLAAESGKKRIVLFVFDGMDWWTSYAAAIAKTGKVPYEAGRGTGLHFQDYRGAPTDFGAMVTSPANGKTKCDVTKQCLVSCDVEDRGGYDPEIGGDTPWSIPTDAEYPIGKGAKRKHRYTDSASSATSMTCGIKTYNDAINVDCMGRQAVPIAQTLQKQGYSIGVVTSVQVSHATPAAAYANNVHRDDYQDLSRDLLGLPSVTHSQVPLPGVDVLIGAGWGENSDKAPAQGDNYVAGNSYLTDADLKAVDVKHGGRYVVANRTAGLNGAKNLQQQAQRAIESKQRLFGYFGVRHGHLPFQTADGKYNPTASVQMQARGEIGLGQPEAYSKQDIDENPTLAEMTTAALDVLSKRGDKFWLMVEAGDVDWANHANNIDNSVGAVLSGDDAFRALTDWIEKNGGWQDTAVILTADHGHYLTITQPQQFAEKLSSGSSAAKDNSAESDATSGTASSSAVLTNSAAK